MSHDIKTAITNDDTIDAIIYRYHPKIANVTPALINIYTSNIIYK